MDNREWFSTEELAGLPGMPGTVQGLRLRAKREGWPWRKRQASGGGREYPLSCLPMEAQATLLAADEPKDSTVPQAPSVVIEVLSSSINGANFEVTMTIRVGRGEGKSASSLSHCPFQKVVSAGRNNRRKVETQSAYGQVETVLQVEPDLGQVEPQVEPDLGQVEPQVEPDLGQVEPQVEPDLGQMERGVGRGTY